MNGGVIQKLEISAIKAETATSRTITLKPLDGWKPRYEAGQFITLVFFTGTGEKRRSYSISSAAAIGEPLAITVKKLDNGEFSRWLVYKAQPGDIVFSSGIGGFFVLPENKDRVYCFIAAGSGITPCFALIKTLLHTPGHPVFLFYSNRTEAEAIFLEDLIQLQKQYADRLHIHFMFSYKLDVLRSRLSHWLLSWLLDRHFSGISREKPLFYLCGPFDFMMMCTISLRNNGFKNEQIIKEDFLPLPPVRTPQPPDKDAHNVKLHVGGAWQTIRVQYPQSITAAAKAAKIAVPYSCEAGRCGSCVATCISGTIWMAYNEVLTDKEIRKGRVLTCQGFPIGDDAEIVYE